MPNLCVNDLSISGPTKEVSEFVKNCAEDEESVMSFEKIVPIPEWAEEENGCLAADVLWGTDRDAFDAAIVSDDDSDADERYVKYAFITAWSPPLGFVQRASKLYASLEFFLEWDASDDGQKGELRACEGQILAHREMRDVPFEDSIWALRKYIAPDDVPFCRKLDPDAFATAAS